jgi:glucosamine--fructose-6-phosphate aminotransferase (isomerizing)
MCGIVGVVAERNATPILIRGLQRLEYRGYDSAGVAVLDSANAIQRCREVGKVQSLVDALACRASFWRHRYRPHPLGNPRQGD